MLNYLAFQYLITTISIIIKYVSTNGKLFFPMWYERLIQPYCCIVLADIKLLNTCCFFFNQCDHQAIAVWESHSCITNVPGRIENLNVNIN